MAEKHRWFERVCRAARCNAAWLVRASSQRRRAGGPGPGRLRGERGLTLVEMMVVVAIIALIGSVVGVAVWKQLDDAKRQVAFTQIKQIGEVLDLYRLRFHHYPSTGDGLQALVQPKGNEEPFMDSLPQDPWGNGYVYIFPAAQNPSGYDLISYGPDGVQGGSDDITNRDDPNKAVE